MTGPGPDPAEISLVLVDGTNWLHRVAGRPDASGLRLLLPRLRAALSAGMRATVVLDGQPDAGAPPRERIGPSLEVRHAGRVDADGMILALVDLVRWDERAGIVVVTDDRGLTERVRRLGARTARLDWIDRLTSRPPATSLSGDARPTAPLGQGRAPRSGSAGSGVDQPRTPWQPGRGATRKRGNPRRGRAETP